MGVSWQVLPGLVLAGVAGSLVDSFLGATVLDVCWCEAYTREAERCVHRCGQLTCVLRRLPWLLNDTVNVVASAAGALLAFWASLLTPPLLLAPWLYGRFRPPPG